MTCRLSPWRSLALTVGAVLGVVCVAWTVGLGLLGITPLVFTSGSMSPTIPAGALGFAHTVEGGELAEGQIASVVNDDGVRVTHRIVDVTEGPTGVSLAMRGDANNVIDAERYVVESADVVVWAVPGAGYVLNAIATPFGMAVGVAVLIAALAAAWMPSTRERRDHPGSTSETPATTRRWAAALAATAVWLLVVLGGSAPIASTLAYFSDSPRVEPAVATAPLFTCAQASGTVDEGGFEPWAYYGFDGGTQMADSATGNWPLTFSGTSYDAYPPPCGRDAGESFAPQGRAATANVAGVSSWNTFSLSAWFWADSSVQGTIIGMASNANATQANRNDRQLWVGESGRLHFSVFDTVRRNIASTALVNDGRWHHAVVVLSPLGMQMYLDGELVASRTDVTAGASYPTGAYWRIGQTDLNGLFEEDPETSTDGSYNGLIDEVGIWTTALTADEVRHLYRSGIPTVPFP